MSITARQRVLFEQLWNHMFRLHTHWRMWNELFGRIDPPKILIKTAPITFGAIQDVLREAIILGIHRLIDPAKSRSHRTASLETLIATMPERTTR